MSESIEELRGYGAAPGLHEILPGRFLPVAVKLPVALLEERGFVAIRRTDLLELRRALKKAQQIFDSLGIDT